MSSKSVVGCTTTSGEVLDETKAPAGGLMGRATDALRAGSFLQPEVVEHHLLDEGGEGLETEFSGDDRGDPGLGLPLDRERAQLGLVDEVAIKAVFDLQGERGAILAAQQGKNGLGLGIRLLVHPGEADLFARVFKACVEDIAGVEDHGGLAGGTEGERQQSEERAEGEEALHGLVTTDWLEEAASIDTQQ